MKNWEIFSIISLVTVIIMVILIMRVKDTKEENANVNSSILGINIFFEEHEFSDILEAWGNIYASGVDGVFVIEHIEEKYESEPIQDEDDFALNSYRQLNTEELRYVKALAFDYKRQVILIGHSDGVTLYDGLSYISTEWLNELKNKAVNDIIISKSGKIYIGTYEGLIIVENGLQVKHLTLKDGLSGDMCNMLYEDDDNNIWCGYYMANIGGVSILKEDKVTQSFNIENGLVHNAITSIAETSHGEILVGGGVYTSGGASRIEFDGEQWNIIQNILFEDGLAGDKVRHIYVDSYQNIWVCSEYDGISIFDSQYKPLKIITDKDGLSDKEIKKIISDKYGNIWMATRRGITVMSKDKINALID